MKIWKTLLGTTQFSQKNMELNATALKIIVPKNVDINITIVYL